MSSWLEPVPGIDHVEHKSDTAKQGAADSPRLQAIRGPRTAMAIPGLALGRGSATVRRIKEDDLKERGVQVSEMAKSAPEKGMNLWVAKHSELDATVHLLGTHHGLHLTQMEAWPAIVRYLRDATFTHVYSETTGRGADGTLPATKQLIEFLETKVTRERELKAAEPESKAAKIANSKIGNLDMQTAKIDTLQLDDAYAALAMACSPTPKRGTLETDESRAEAHQQNADDGVKTSKPAADAKVQEAQNAKDKADVATGNQQAIFSAQAEEMAAGLDLASAEERNRRWVAGTTVGKKDNQVWIVGAAHLPGLIVRLKKDGWTTEHQPVS